MTIYNTENTFAEYTILTSTPNLLRLLKSILWCAGRLTKVANQHNGYCGGRRHADVVCLASVFLCLWLACGCFRVSKHTRLLPCRINFDKLAILRFEYVVAGIHCTSNIPAGATFALEQNHIRLDSEPGVVVTGTPFAPCLTHRDCYVVFEEDQVAGEDAAVYDDFLPNCNLIIIASGRRYALHARREIPAHTPIRIHTRLWKRVSGTWHSRLPFDGSAFETVAVPPLVYQP